ncbi:CD225/dispanin family protein [Kaistella palustris]|uniref:CD225/dispanin family protein n=1 Tax=Kaistella palustris TaxID=493376 RepID=UPI00040416B3|nr:CD225/dispanin family protein [Kaistella palustris]
MENFSQPSDFRPSPNGFPPKSWLVESIIVTILCCVPLGIVGIISAASVEGKYAKGDIAGAQKAANLAKTMVLISAISGLVAAFVYIVFFGGLALFYNTNS